MEAAYVGLAGEIIGAVLSELLSLLRARTKNNIDAKRQIELIKELVGFIKNIQASYRTGSSACKFGHTERAPEALFDKLEKLRASKLLPPSITVELMFLQQALKNLDENIRCFYEAKLNDGNYVKESEYMLASGDRLLEFISRVEKQLNA